MVLEQIILFKEKHGMSYKIAAELAGWKMASLKRRLKKMRKSGEPQQTRGRKKRVVRMEDIENLKADLEKMRHGPKRSQGTGELRKKYSGLVPRKMFRKLLCQARKEYKKQLAESWEHVSWHCPGLVWSMDIVEIPFNDRKFYILQTMDMTTKYKFDPLIGTAMFHGEEVAGHTARLYQKYGAPLFQKRDNGGNLNDGMMREVLSETCVIPLNSPAYYPRYNGSMENGQCELKKEIQRIIEQESISTDEGFIGAVHRATYAMNHKRRRILGRETSCFNLSRNNPPVYDKQKRTEVYQWIKELTVDIEQNGTYSDKELWFRKAWRNAVESWLINHRFITVSTPEIVLPISA